VIKGEFNVVGITRTELHDIFAYDDADVWYKVKVTYEAEGDDEEKKKKISQIFLVSAHSVKDAYDRIKESLSSLMVDFQIPSIAVSPIVEIFPYHENLDREIERKPILTEEDIQTKGKVFSAPGTDIDDDELLPEEDESELEDEYTDEE
jgi:hypothetical protein